MDRRTTGLVLVGIAAALLLVGILGHQFWTLSGKEGIGGIGLREASGCDRDGGGCQTIGLGQLGKEHAAFVYSGTLTYFVGIFALIAAAIACGLAFGRTPLGGPVSPARIGLLLFAITGIGSIVFVVTAPSEISKAFSFGAGMPLTLAGAGCGVAGMLMLDKLARQLGASSAAAAPMMMPPGMPAPMMPPGGVPAPMQQPILGGAQTGSPACPQCRAPTTWVAEHNRFYCARCSIYV